MKSLNYRKFQAFSRENNLKAGGGFPADPKRQEFSGKSGLRGDALNRIVFQGCRGGVLTVPDVALLSKPFLLALEKQPAEPVLVAWK